MITVTTRPSRRRISLPVWLATIGVIFGICTLATMIGTGVDFYQETKHAKWPAVAATVNWSIVQQATQPRLRSAQTERVWYVESQVRYTVDGQEARSSVRSRITSFRETRDEMRAWVSRHGAGTTLPMRYDPQQPADAVLDAAADMPEAGPKAGDDLKMFLVFLLATIVFASAAWLLRRGAATS